jgi:hypothetical protein
MKRLLLISAGVVAAAVTITLTVFSVLGRAPIGLALLGVAGLVGYPYAEAGLQAVAYRRQRMHGAIPDVRHARGDALVGRR